MLLWERLAKSLGGRIYEEISALTQACCGLSRSPQTERRVRRAPVPLDLVGQFPPRCNKELYLLSCRRCAKSYLGHPPRLFTSGVESMRQITPTRRLTGSSWLPSPDTFPDNHFHCYRSFDKKKAPFWISEARRKKREDQLMAGSLAGAAE